MKEAWKIGELAELAGLTVRTLRHYDQIGLFSPSRHTETGHRQYTKEDMERLQPILSLKQLGLSLKEIQATLSHDRKDSAVSIIQAQIDQVRREISRSQRLLEELETALLAARHHQARTVEDILNLLEAFKLNQNKYFSEQQMAGMRKTFEKTDEQQVARLEEEFKSLIGQIRKEKMKGTSPSSPEVRKFAQRWNDIVDTFSGKDPELRKQAEQFHYDHPGNELQYEIDEDLYAYIYQALQP